MTFTKSLAYGRSLAVASCLNLTLSSEKPVVLTCGWIPHPCRGSPFASVTQRVDLSRPCDASGTSGADVVPEGHVVLILDLAVRIGTSHGPVEYVVLAHHVRGVLGHPYAVAPPREASLVDVADDYTLHGRRNPEAPSERVGTRAHVL